MVAEIGGRGCTIGRPCAACSRAQQSRCSRVKDTVDRYQEEKAVAGSTCLSMNGRYEHPATRKEGDTASGIPVATFSLPSLPRRLIQNDLFTSGRTRGCNARHPHPVVNQAERIRHRNIRSSSDREDERCRTEQLARKTGRRRLGRGT